MEKAVRISPRTTPQATEKPIVVTPSVPSSLLKAPIHHPLTAFVRSFILPFRLDNGVSSVLRIRHLVWWVMKHRCPTQRSILIMPFALFLSSNDLDIHLPTVTSIAKYDTLHWILSRATLFIDSIRMSFKRRWSGKICRVQVFPPFPKCQPCPMSGYLDGKLHVGSASLRRHLRFITIIINYPSLSEEFQLCLRWAEKANLLLIPL